MKSYKGEVQVGRREKKEKGCSKRRDFIIHFLINSNLMNLNVVVEDNFEYVCL